MVSVASIIMMALSLILSVGVPVAALIYAVKKYRCPALSILMGVLSFSVLQGVRIMYLLPRVGAQPWFQALMANQFVLYAIVMGFSAGIFEGAGRFGFGQFLRKHPVWAAGLGFGIGHGGIESLLLGGSNMLNNLINSASINAGVFDAIFGPVLGAQADTVKQALIYTPSWQFAIGGIERVLAFTVQIGLCMLVIYGIRRRRFGYTLLAVLLHGLLDTGAVLIMQYVPLINIPIHPQTAGILAAELYCALFAAASAIWVAKAKPLMEEPLPQETL